MENDNNVNIDKLMNLMEEYDKRFGTDLCYFDFFGWSGESIIKALEEALRTGKPIEFEDDPDAII